MIECTLQLDLLFGSLSDPTRRDILKRVAQEDLSVSDVAEPYRISLAAVSKHVKILEQANLVVKERRGKQQMVRLAPEALKSAETYLEHYQTLWEDRFDALEEYLQNNK